MGGDALERTAIVLGAGAAGLAAGARLKRAGLRTIVLEARDRYGGRVETRIDPVLGVPIELGAEFVHGRPPETLRLARRARARVAEVKGRILAYRSGRLEPADRSYERLEEILALGDRAETSVAELVRSGEVVRRFTRLERDMALGFVEGFYLADPRRASSGAIALMTRAEEKIGGDRAYRVVDGYRRVLEPLARALSPERDELRLSTVVEEVRWRPGAVEVRARAPGGAVLPPIQGRWAVVTLPVAVLAANDVRFSPPLPEKRRALARLEMGPVVKLVLRFRRRFWEPPSNASRRSLRDLAFVLGRRLPIPTWWTLAPMRAPVLVGWAGGPAAARLGRSRPERILRVALGSLARAFAVPAAQLAEQLDGWSVADWRSDPFARGGYAVFPVGTVGIERALARPESGTLFFAGEATDVGGGAGTVAGAIATGERAALEVLAAR